MFSDSMASVLSERSRDKFYPFKKNNNILLMLISEKSSKESRDKN